MLACGAIDGVSCGLEREREVKTVSRENLWLVKCTDRDGDDVDGLREEPVSYTHLTLPTT